MKKMVCIMLCVVLTFACCSAAMAAPKHVSADGLYQLVDEANAKIEGLVDYAISTPENDVKWLLHQIDKIVHDVRSYAKKVNMSVACDMCEMIIDGQTVMIDPLIVVNIGH